MTYLRELLAQELGIILRTIIVDAKGYRPEIPIFADTPRIR